MFIEFRMKAGAFLLAMIAALSIGASHLRAATIEVESEDEDVMATPTQVSVPSHTASSKPKTSESTGSPSKGATPTPVSSAAQLENPGGETASTLGRVRISDNVGFYSFVKAGYVADPSKVSCLGKVVGSYDYNMNYTADKKTYIELSSDGIQVSPDDLFVIYRAVTPVDESHAGGLGFEIKNLAVVKVLEVQKQRCLVEVIKSLHPFKEGDKVGVYDSEVKRWKQAQTKKPLPSHPVRCFVAGGEDGIINHNQLDFIYLSAGTKKGVVEGQTFQLRELTDIGLLQDNLDMPRGVAQVIFAGPDVSTALILTNHEPIQKGFEAIYQP